MEENYIYELKSLLEYTPKGEGDFKETGCIEFVPPSMKVFDEASDFEQIMMGVMMSLAGETGIKADDKDEKNLDDIETPDANAIRSMLFANQKIKFTEVAKKFKALALKTAMLDEKTPIKEVHFKELSLDDFKNMLCGYASFFTFPSLLRGE